MGDIFVFETTYDMDDCLGFTDITEELVSEALPLARALDETRDVHEFDRCVHSFCRFDQLRYLIQSVIRNGDDGSVGFDGAKGIIGRFGLLAPGQSIEKSAFTNIWQADDSDA